MNLQKYAEHVSLKRHFVEISVEEFKNTYPESTLIIDQVIPKYPESLRSVNLDRKQMGQINLHPVILSSVCGMIFGDGSLAINQGYKNARLQIRHSSRQTEWFMWKCICILSGFMEENSICFQKPDGFQRKKEAFGGETLGKWKVLTKTDTELTKIYSILYKKRKKTLQRSWLNHMNNYFLMVLWLDDGSLNDARQGVISLNNTPLDQAQVLVDYIANVWGIKSKAVIVKSKSTHTNVEPVAITISDLENLEKLLRIIAPIVPVKSMLYKVCIYPKDRSRLQRWTSELKTLVKEEWHCYLDKYYSYLDVINQKKI